MIALLALPALAAAPAAVGGSFTGVGTGLLIGGPALVATSFALPRGEGTFVVRSATASLGGLAIGLGAIAVVVSPIERARAMSDVGYEVSDRAGRLALLGFGSGVLLGVVVTTVAITTEEPTLLSGNVAAGGLVAAGVIAGWVQGARNRRALATQPLPEIEVALAPTARGIALVGQF